MASIFRRPKSAPLLFLILTCAIPWSCAEEQMYVRRSEVLNQTAELVILPTYNQFTANTGALHQSIAELCDAPNATNLHEAQDAWRQSRQSWKRTESFELGPALELQTRNKVDKSALLADKLETLISSSEAIDASMVEKNSSYTRGFLALEYLLFPENEDENEDAFLKALTEAPDTGDRRCRMAAAIAEFSAAAGAELSTAWKTEDGDYLDLFLASGDSEGEFASDKDGVDALFNALLNHISDILELSLAKPAGLMDSEGEPDPSLISTQRSGHGRQDILDNLAGVRLLLDGPETEASTTGIGALIKARKPSLYDTMLVELEAAHLAAAAIPEPLSDAVVSSPDAVTAAYDALKNFHVRLGSDGATLLGISLSVNEVDND